MKLSDIVTLFERLDLSVDSDITVDEGTLRVRSPIGVTIRFDIEEATLAVRRAVVEAVPVIPLEVSEELIHVCGVMCGCIDSPHDKHMVPYSKAPPDARHRHDRECGRLVSVTDFDKITRGSVWRDCNGRRIQVDRPGSTCVYYTGLNGPHGGHTPYEDFIERFALEVA